VVQSMAWRHKLALILSVAGVACPHERLPGITRNEGTEPLARDYLALVDTMSASQAQHVLGCIPRRWALMESASEMVSMMQMDDASIAEMERSLQHLTCREGMPPVDCCNLAYHAAVAGDEPHALATYSGTCEPMGGTGYIGCLPLLALWPHTTESRPDWMPSLSQRDRVQVAAWAIAKARDEASQEVGGR
jgi:hypothetical protein